MSDLISRQAAIDAISTWDKFGIDERNRVVRWHEGLEPYVKLRDVVWAIEKLPSAQPEPCVDTIDALNESIKHFDDMAEECRRNANIERNDYMDMRDDAAEYRQLSTWLNELRWLRERFQSQPQRKKGKWIGYNTEQDGWKRTDGSPVFMSCSECNGLVLNNGSAHWNYCPNCGARME